MIAREPEAAATSGDARAMADGCTVDAELAVLGSVLLNEHALAAVVDEGLRPTHFGSWRHQAIFATIIVLRQDDRSVDPILLNDQLDNQGILDEVGGRAYVHTLMDMPFVCRRVRSYAQITLRRYQERARVRIGEELSRGEIDAEGARRRLRELEGGTDA